MKTGVIIAASGLAVGGLYLGGAFERGEVYNLSIDDTRSRLSAMSFPRDVLNSAGGSDTSLSIGDEGNTYSWNVTAGDYSTAVFTAHLTIEGPSKTRVRLDYKNGRSSSEWSDKLMSTSFMRSYAEASFHEQLDAALESRPADQGQAMQAFAIRAAANPQEMREVGLATQEIFKDVASQLKDAQSGSYGAYGQYGQYNAQASARERMRNATRPNYEATRPMTDLRRD